MLISAMIADIRFVSIGGAKPFLEVKRAEPIVDASGAICGFQQVDTWEQVNTFRFDRPDSYYEYRAYDDLAASGGVVEE